MKPYRIKRRICYRWTVEGMAYDGHYSMQVINRATGELLSESLLTPGREDVEIRAMRRSIDRHLETPGSTLYNYGW